jgi:TonB family protein
MMSRGLPYSLFVHGLGLVLVFFFGNHVSRQPLTQPRAISVQMVRMPEINRPPAEVVREAVPAAPQEEIKPDLPPKQIPEPKVQEKPVERTPQPEVKQPEPEVVEPPSTTEAPEVQAAAVISPPSVTGLDSDFPFAWYISQTEAKIIRNWKPRQLGFGKRAVVSCTVHFVIGRNGNVTQVTLIRNSGVGVYDREALRAVSTTKLPPLPPQYTGQSLGVTFIFNLEPDK